jgi:type I restriction enzyme R subunit
VHYTDAKGKGQPTAKAENALKILREKLDVVRGIDARRRTSAFRDEAAGTAGPGRERHPQLDDGKKRFLDVMASVTKAYSPAARWTRRLALRTIAFLRDPRFLLQAAVGTTDVDARVNPLRR